MTVFFLKNRLMSRDPQVKHLLDIVRYEKIKEYRKDYYSKNMMKLRFYGIEYRKKYQENTKKERLNQTIKSRFRISSD